MSSDRPRVLVVGGGIAGVEALLALRELAGARLSLALLADAPELVLRPLLVAAPFGDDEEGHRVPLEEICDALDVRLHRDRLTFVDTRRRQVETAGGSVLAYDELVVAVGAVRRPALAGALTFDGIAGVGAYRELLADLAAGRAHTVAFAMPAGVTWPLPLYELALMTAAAVEGRDVRLTVVTPEDDPLIVFGTPARDRVREMLADHDIDVRTSSTPLEVAGRFLLSSGGAIPADRIVALPALEGPRVPGLPHDAQGFVPVDEHGRVDGQERVFAAGDGTDAPLKQGGLATQQADAVAELIASRHGAPCTPEPFRPVLRAQLLTGALPWFFRAGGHASPVASRSALWRPAGKVAARYLAPFLAERGHGHLGPGESLRDLPAREADEAELAAALELALTLADDEAESGDPVRALHWLDVAEAIGGPRGAEYAVRRRVWAAAAEPDATRVREPGGDWHRP